VTQPEHVYAPPAVEETDAAPARHDPFLAAWALCALVFAWLLLTALALRLGSSRPTGLLPKPVYEALFTLHGGFAIPFVNSVQLASLAVAAPIHVDERLRRAMAWATMGLIGVESIARALLLVPALLSRWIIGVSFWLPSCALGVCMVLAAPRWRRLGGPPVVVSIAAAIASVVLPAARGDLSFVLCATALQTSQPRDQRPDAAHGSRSSLASGLVLALCGLLVFRAVTDWGFELSSLLWVFASAWLATISWRPASSIADRSARLAARSGLLFVAVTLILRTFQYVASLDYLGDTLLVVAADHGMQLALILLLLALAMRERRSAPPHGAGFHWVRVGIACFAFGALGFVWCIAILGTRGMPRRYMAYLPEFTGLQQWASAWALVLAAGVVLTGVGFAKQRILSARN